MFESVLNPRRDSKAGWGASTVLAVAVHAGLIGFAIWLSKHPPERMREDVEVLFLRAPPPPPPPPPPPAPKKTTPKVERKPIKKPDTIIQPKEIPAEPPPPSAEPQQQEDEGVEGGVEGGVAGGVVGGVLGGVIGGQKAAPQPRLEVDDAVVHLTKLSGPDPEYTQKALDHEVEGVMMVKCVVAIDGSVRDCRVLKSLPFMDRAVVDALERRRYKPYLFQGMPREVDCTFRVRLQLPR